MSKSAAARRASQPTNRYANEDISVLRIGRRRNLRRFRTAGIHMLAGFRKTCPKPQPCQSSRNVRSSPETPRNASPQSSDSGGAGLATWLSRRAVRWGGSTASFLDWERSARWLTAGACSKRIHSGCSRVGRYVTSWTSNHSVKLGIGPR